MRSEATTVEDYLNELPEDRANAIAAVRQTILDNLDAGFQETMNFGMIAYEVPLAVYPDTYNGQPLMYAALASQKNHMAVYLHCIYSDPETSEKFKAAYKATGKRYDCGKSCVRFRKLGDLPLELVGEAIASFTVEGWVELCDAIFKKTGGRKRKRS